jgi:uncharacterized membrane protein
MRRAFLTLILSQACACAGPQNLTIDDAANATFHDILEDPVTLVDGEFAGRPFQAGASSRPIVRMSAESSILADVDADGDDEVIAVLAASFGGSGTYTHIAIVDETGGAPASTATIELGDRVHIESMTYDKGHIIATTLEHAATDPMCCPSVRRHRQWQWSKGGLVEIEAGPAIARVRGQVVIGHETRTLSLCGGEKESWLIDATGGNLHAIYGDLAVEPYQPLFFELEGSWEDATDTGFGAEFDRSFRATSVLRAEREGFGCEEDLASFRFRAGGNEPSWQMMVGDNVVRFSSLSGDSLETSEASVSERGDILRVSAPIDTRRISAEFVPERCVDPMSGSVFSYVARVSIGETEYSGCAIEGQADAN